MIFRLSTLQGIKDGTISLAFRKWKKPAVRKGSRIKTEMAVVEISDMSAIGEEDITNKDAVSAGFKDLEHLLEVLNATKEGTIYKIQVRYYSEDPRIALRENIAVSDKDLEGLKTKLERLDRFSKEGNWTLEVLKMIKDNPKLRAADLAAIMNVEKDALKLNIRKLKNLGLTISHDVGYTVSPLGELLLRTLTVKTLKVKS